MTSWQRRLWRQADESAGVVGNLDMSSIYSGLQIGPFKIVRHLGRGGMGDVYLAENIKEERKVALKLIQHGTDKLTQQAIDAERRGAELQEGLYAMDDRIAEVYNYGDLNDHFYIEMEYVEGDDLSALIGRGALSAYEAARIAREICDTLDNAHSYSGKVDDVMRAIVHGDIKPQNVRRDKSKRVRLLDFGIAKALKPMRHLTRNEFGSTSYASPERLDTGRVNEHSDLWSVGVLLYEMLVGTQPFTAEDDRALEQLILSRPSPPQMPESCPQALRDIVKKALSPEIGDRYQSASAMKDALNDYVRGNQPPRKDDGKTKRTKPETQEPEPRKEEPKPEPELKPELKPELEPEPVIKRRNLLLVIKAVIKRWNLLLVSKIVSVALALLVASTYLIWWYVNRPPSGSFETVKLDASGNVVERRSGTAQILAEDLGDVNLEMIAVPGGKLDAGSLSGGAVRPFYIGKFEMTQAQWQAVVGSENQTNRKLSKPSPRFEGDDMPVQRISLENALEFCALLARKTGKPYRLPTEVEWEYAARAGSKTAYAFGDVISSEVANCAESKRGQTTEAGSLKFANAFGLYDMHGNVWEWCQATRPGRNVEAQANRNAGAGGKNAQAYVLRGGSWRDKAENCRSESRIEMHPDTATIGFRVVLTQPLAN